MFAYRRALAPGGRYRCVGGSVPTLLRVLTVGCVARPAHAAAGWACSPSARARRTSSPLADLCVAGDIGIHIDRTFALDEVPEALAHVGEGRALGKVVVTP